MQSSTTGRASGRRVRDRCGRRPDRHRAIRPELAGTTSRFAVGCSLGRRAFPGRSVLPAARGWLGGWWPERAAARSGGGGRRTPYPAGRSCARGRSRRRATPGRRALLDRRVRPFIGIGTKGSNAHDPARPGARRVRPFIGISNKRSNTSGSSRGGALSGERPKRRRRSAAKAHATPHPAQQNAGEAARPAELGDRRGGGRQARHNSTPTSPTGTGRAGAPRRHRPTRARPCADEGGRALHLWGLPTRLRSGSTHPFSAKSGVVAVEHARTRQPGATPRYTLGRPWTRIRGGRDLAARDLEQRPMNVTRQG
jgi:hypothetical protein